MIDPILFNLGPLNVRWYGLIMALAFFFGAIMAVKLGKHRNLKKSDILEFLIYLIPLSIIFARLVHVLIPNFTYYMNNPILIFAIWKGGVSIHGGLLGGIIAAFIFCKRRKIHFYDLADVFIIPLSFGIIFGRIGNLINQELYGKLTNLPWGMYFKGVEGKRHPAQIYESIMHAVIFITLLQLYKIKSLPRGFIFWSFISLYSLFRFFSEFVREGTTFFLNLTIIQWISIPLFILGVIMLYKLKAFKTFINQKNTQKI